MKKIILGLLMSIILWGNARPIQAIDDAKSFSAKVDQIIEEKEITLMDSKQWYQKLKLRAIDGELAGKFFEVENGNEPLANVNKYKVGDKVMVNSNTNEKGEITYYVSDYIRHDGLILLLAIFLIATIAVAKEKGFLAILSMVFTFGVIFLFVLPRIAAGNDPTLIAVIASILIIPPSFYLSHGFNRKTTIAIVASLITLAITSVLSLIFIKITYLTGLSSEEAGMLSIDKKGTLNMAGILMAGIMIGALGVLDDITISQAAIVNELAITAKLRKAADLYSKAMNIGKDHITSMINTLFLAYAGAALPLLLIFIGNPHPFSEIINFEMISEEIVRTLVGSIGLILAVPITTILAAVWIRRK